MSRGPLYMRIAVRRGGEPAPELAHEGAERALDLLEDLSEWLGVIRLSSSRIKRVRAFPPIVQEMIRATQQMGSPDLTPLAAVAGALSDQVADYLEERGGRRVIVDNGGDIALRLHRGERASVGLRLDVRSQDCPYRLRVDQKARVGGIATSGLGGRSFTKGVASAAVSIAPTAVCADAAATVLGNATSVEDPEIEMEMAETLYPETDIPGHRVVTRVGAIGEDKVDEALEKGLRAASLLVERGLIRGAVIAVKGRVGWTANLACQGDELYLGD